jgi:hypothetical protein
VNSLPCSFSHVCLSAFKSKASATASFLVFTLECVELQKLFVNQWLLFAAQVPGLGPILCQEWNSIHCWPDSYIPCSRKLLKVQGGQLQPNDQSRATGVLARICSPYQIQQRPNQLAAVAAGMGSMRGLSSIPAQDSITASQSWRGSNSYTKACGGLQGCLLQCQWGPRPRPA